MKNEKEIYDLRKEVESDINYLNIKINTLKEKEETLQKICNHSIVFSMADTSQYKNTDAKVELLICPACGKTIKSFNKDINDISFVKSEIIKLDDIDLADKPNAISTIEDETLKNYDYYYDTNIKKEFKAISMKNAISDKVKKKDF